MRLPARFRLPPHPVTPGLRGRLEYALIRVLADPAPRRRRLLRKLIGDRRYVVEAAGLCVEGRFRDVGDLCAIEEVLGLGVYDLALPRVRPDLILDLGANIGLFSLLAARRFPEVSLVCFEPDPGNFALLERNLARNCVAPRGCHRVAVGATSGQGSLTGMVGTSRRLAAAGDTAVPVRRLGELVDLSAVGALLFKCDVEGAEFDILGECLGQLPRDTFMFIEVHEGESALFRLRHVLGQAGFEVTPTRARGLAIDCVATRGRYAAPAM